MILDLISHLNRYERLHPGFAAALRWISTTELNSLKPGRHAIDGERLFALANHEPAKGRQAARLESHRRYIDIQLTLAGEEEIGFRPVADCAAPEVPFLPDNDIAFYAERPDTWLAVPPGRFAIFYPHDAHAPLAGQGDLQKVVIKVALQW